MRAEHEEPSRAARTDHAATPAAPSELVAPARRPEVESWWEALDPASRRAVRVLWDDRRDDLSQAYVDPELGWQDLPIELHGQFVDPQDELDAGLARRELLEYINAHPEIAFFLETRKFHICRAHARARRVVERGVIPSDFVCPLRESPPRKNVPDRACPFESALETGGGRSIVLTARLLREKPRPGKTRA